MVCFWGPNVISSGLVFVSLGPRVIIHGFHWGELTIYLKSPYTCRGITELHVFGPTFVLGGSSQVSIFSILGNYGDRKSPYWGCSPSKWPFMACE